MNNNTDAFITQMTEKGFIKSDQEDQMTFSILNTFNKIIVSVSNDLSVVVITFIVPIQGEKIFSIPSGEDAFALLSAELDSLPVSQ